MCSTTSEMVPGLNVSLAGADAAGRGVADWPGCFSVCRSGFLQPKNAIANSAQPSTLTVTAQFVFEIVGRKIVLENTRAAQD